MKPCCVNTQLKYSIWKGRLLQLFPQPLCGFSSAVPTLGSAPRSLLGLIDVGLVNTEGRSVEWVRLIAEEMSETNIEWLK